MSSHHFVKEQQEPAVVILDIEDFSWEQLSGLFEWVPTVLVAEPAVEQVLSWGIKIDVILASSAFQKENIHLLEEQYPLRFFESGKGKFTQDALHYLMASDHRAAHLVGFPIGQFDDLALFMEKLDLCIFDQGKKYFPVKSGELKKWYPKGELELFGQKEQLVRIENKEEILDPSAYISISEGLNHFYSEKLFWIGESLT
ncbi:thiamine pyrophosphokinase [Algoriphagus kandeliae]|uniref:Thiamine pyrophosphokinase n=1 Tax=Algoriphagus kandeliae TaxID=2562278 RepID=A0A4Y9QUF5_9BACT|nr:thiamine pyrophosphokinase [Algoriphagus kandeliae]TFV95777.1 thiamine pyrophosphokinase [Algoriphagus kandeliae]